MQVILVLKKINVAYLQSMKAGFTVIELLVVIAIIGIVSTITVANYPEFRRSLAVEREAQIVALTLRDAEARAISVRRVDTSFTVPFGVHFVPGIQYVIFSDNNGNGIYDSGVAAGELLETIQMSRHTKINNLCAGAKNTPAGPCNLSALSVIFKRPSPTVEARVSAGAPLTHGNFEVDVYSDDNNLKKRITVWTTGAITIEKLP